MLNWGHSVNAVLPFGIHITIRKTKPNGEEIEDVNDRRAESVFVCDVSLYIYCDVIEGCPWHGVQSSTAEPTGRRCLIRFSSYKYLAKFGEQCLRMLLHKTNIYACRKVLSCCAICLVSFFVYTYFSCR